MVKRRTTHLLIGFLRKTALFPWTEPPLRGYVGGRAHRQQDSVGDKPRGWQGAWAAGRVGGRGRRQQGA